MQPVRSRPHSLGHAIALIGRIFTLCWKEERLLTILCLIFGSVWPVLGIVQPLLMGRLIDSLTHEHFDAAYRIIGLWAGAVILFMTSLYINRLASDHIKHSMKTKAGLWFTQRALTMDYDYYAQTHSGWLLKVMNRGDEALGSAAHELLGWAYGYCILLICVVPISLWINPWGGAVIFFILLVVTITLAFLFGRTSHKQIKIEDMRTRIYGEAGDAFANAVPLQSYTAVDWSMRRISRLLDRSLKWQRPILTWWAISNSLVQGAERFSLLAIAFVGTWLISRGELTAGELGSFILLIVYVVPHLVMLFDLMKERFFWDYVYITDMLRVIDSEPSIQDAQDAKPLALSQGSVAFENVSFNYPMRAGVLQNISFEIKPGQTVALVGATGAGKTTIARLLMRYYEPSGGRILIDGQDVNHVTLQSLRESITVLFQDSFVLNQNIADNLRLSCADLNHTEMLGAAKGSLFDSVIAHMPKGLATRLGERGIKLSGGEKQRLAIARALLRNTKILILDEATSSLDAATEAVLQESLNNLTKDRSTLIIAHRLSTIRHADQILVLEKGQIVERGTFRELLGKGGVFTRLVAAQRDGMIVD